MITHRCKECGDTGLLIPLEEFSLERLISCKNNKYVMGCDYCDVFFNQPRSRSFELNSEYVNKMIQQKYNDNAQMA